MDVQLKENTGESCKCWREIKCKVIQQIQTFNNWKILIEAKQKFIFDRLTLGFYSTCNQQISFQQSSSIVSVNEPGNLTVSTGVPCPTRDRYLRAFSPTAILQSKYRNKKRVVTPASVHEGKKKYSKNKMYTKRTNNLNLSMMWPYKKKKNSNTPHG